MHDLKEPPEHGIDKGRPAALQLQLLGKQQQLQHKPLLRFGGSPAAAQGPVLVKGQLRSLRRGRSCIALDLEHACRLSWIFGKH